ncbi:MAG: cupin domain-containing protein, partial [Cellulomonas sp.]
GRVRLITPERSMSAIVVPPGGGTEHDWTQDHVFVKTAADLTSGRVTVVEDLLKPGFHLARHHHQRTVEIFYILDGDVTFTFDDTTTVAGPGTTLTIPSSVWHEVTCPGGGRLLTAFTPGGFDTYLDRLARMDDQQLQDPESMRRLNETYDIWNAT